MKEKKDYEKKKEKERHELEQKLTSIKKNLHYTRDKRRINSLENKLSDLMKEEMGLQDIFRILCEPNTEVIFPNIKKVVLLALLCPVGNAIVERLFSKMKLTKTVLRNSLGDEMLDMLLRLNVEAPATFSDDDKDKLVDLFVLRKKRAGKGFKWNI